MLPSKHGLVLLHCLLFISLLKIDAVPTSYSRHDPFPVYTTLDPYTFLYKKERFIDNDGIERQRYVPQTTFFSISPFGQSADATRNARKELIPLGDIYGRWNMLALLYGPTPACCTLPPVLLEAQQALYPTLTPPICNQPVDPCQQFGYFSAFSKYTKRGLRADLNFHIIGDIGINIQVGVSDICNTVSCIVNLTDCSPYSDADLFDPSNPALTPDNVDTYLMNKLNTIACQTGLDISSYHKTTAEDIRLNLFWRRAYEGNMTRNDWPNIYFMPFAMLSGVIAVGKEPYPNQIFGLSHGNNDHHSVAGSAGINIDFVETVDVGFEVGATYFFPRSFNCLRVPNDVNQQTIFPFNTDTRVSPGWNWHFAGKLGAYHFLEHLSFYFQYVIISHQDDNLCIKNSDNAFVPCALENISTFKSQLANISFDYDIAPHVSLGVLWQAPLMQLFAFKSTSILLSLNVFF